MNYKFSCIKKPTVFFEFSEVERSPWQEGNEGKNPKNLNPEARGEEVGNPDAMNLDTQNKKKNQEVAQHQIDNIHTAENKEFGKNPPPNLDNPEIATLAFGDFPPKTPESQKTQAAGVEGVKSESPKA